MDTATGTVDPNRACAVPWGSASWVCVTGGVASSAQSCALWFWLPGLTLNSFTRVVYARTHARFRVEGVVSRRDVAILLIPRRAAFPQRGTILHCTVQYSNDKANVFTSTAALQRLLMSHLRACCLYSMGQWRRLGVIARGRATGRWRCASSQRFAHPDGLSLRLTSANDTLDAASQRAAYPPTSDSTLATAATMCWSLLAFPAGQTAKLLCLVLAIGSLPGPAGPFPILQS